MVAFPMVPLGAAALPLAPIDIRPAGAPAKGVTYDCLVLPFGCLAGMPRGCAFFGHDRGPDVGAPFGGPGARLPHLRGGHRTINGRDGHHLGPHSLLGRPSVGYLWQAPDRPPRPPGAWAGGAKGPR